jgi:hypothetical protein
LTGLIADLLRACVRTLLCRPSGALFVLPVLTDQCPLRFSKFTPYDSA